MDPDERAFAISKYAADRAHELELDKAVAVYEHGYFKGLFAINGGTALAFVAARMNDGVLVAPDVWSFCLALGCWGLGLTMALIAGWTAYDAQKLYVAALRSQRHALGLRLFGRIDQAILPALPADTIGSLATSSEARQRSGDQLWTTAHNLGLISAGLWLVGGIFAVVNLLP